MIAHRTFQELRLSQFLPAADIRPLENWEFMGRLWVGEAAGFTEWLYPKRRKSSLGSMSLDLVALPAKVATSILATLKLSLKPGMTLGQIKKILGEPVAVEKFAPDRTSYDFALSAPDHYSISCTILNKGGLAHLVVMPKVKR